MAEAHIPRVDTQALLTETSDVIHALMRFHDGLDPRTGSILFLGGTKTFRSDPFHPGFLTGVEERGELLRRLRRIGSRERLLLFLWYVDGWSASDIAQHLGISRVHCYRLRNRALNDMVAPEGAPRGRSRGAAGAIERLGT